MYVHKYHHFPSKNEKRVEARPPTARFNSLYDFVELNKIGNFNVFGVLQVISIIKRPRSHFRVLSVSYLLPCGAQQFVQLCDRRGNA